MSRYSQTVMDETQARALKYLDAARIPQIFAALCTRGYSEDEHEEGWRLLLKASGRERKAPMMTGDAEASDALVQLDQWDDPTFKVARAVLGWKYLDQLEFVFENLEAGQGAGAIVAASGFLDRLDVLESGKGRKDTHKADVGALEELAKHGIDKAERKRVRELIELAKKASPAPDATLTEAWEAAEAERLQAIEELRGWYDKWAGIAKVVVTRRDHLIRLGLAKRKVGKKNGGQAAVGEADGGTGGE